MIDALAHIPQKHSARGKTSSARTTRWLERVRQKQTAYRGRKIWKWLLALASRWRGTHACRFYLREPRQADRSNGQVRARARARTARADRLLSNDTTQPTD